MERKQEDILTALRSAKGVVYYGESLLEMRGGDPSVHAAPLREEARQRADQLQPTGDVLNTMRNIATLQHMLSSKLHATLLQVFAGPIAVQDELSAVLLRKFPFSVPPYCLMQTGEVGLCRLGVKEGGDMSIALDSERAAVRDAIHDILYREAVVREVQVHGIFFASLIGLCMSRDCGDFVEMLDLIHRSGGVTVFDTNYRSYVMEHCYPQHNKRPAVEIVAEIVPKIDVLLAGTEDVFALEPAKDRSIERAQRGFFMPARPSTLCVLKAGRDGAYWRDEEGAWHHRSAVPVKVHSTAGAGDAFNAGLLLGLRHGKTLEESVIFASAVAAEIVASEESFLSESAAAKLLPAFQS